ncbi:MAG: SPOR domain-containing protein [Nitrospinota bacterium]
MMDTEEKLTPPEIDQNDTNKYKKHINDLIEDAEIEAEMEAEKKIRSKNSRVFSISMFGLGLLALVYMQINSPEENKLPPEEIATPEIAALETAEEKLAQQVPIVEDGSTQIPLEKVKPPQKNVEPAKITFGKKPVSTEKAKAPASARKIIKKKAETTKPSKNLKTAPVKSNTRFFVQTGAFSKKQNAEASMKKLQDKGFSPLIHVVTRNNKKTYLVQLSVFPNKEKAKLAQEKLGRAGFPKSIIK